MSRTNKGDITEPSLGEREKLLSEIEKDERDDDVEDLFEEAKEMYADSTDSFTAMKLDDEALRNVMRLCWEAWAREIQ